MKKLIRFSAMALLTWGLASCSNDFSKEPSRNDPAGNSLFSPVKTPKVNAWSGTQSLNNGVYGTRAEETDAPAPITEEEVTLLKELLDIEDFRTFDWANNQRKKLIEKHTDYLFIPYYKDKDNNETTPNLLGAFIKPELYITVEDLSSWSDYFVQQIATSNPLNSFEAANSEWFAPNDEKIENLAIWSKSISREELDYLSEEEYNNSSERVNIIYPTANPVYIEDAQLIRNHIIKDMSYGNYRNRTFINMGNSATAKTVRFLKLDPNKDEVYAIIYYIQVNNVEGNGAGSDDNYPNGYWNRIIKLTKIASLPEVTEPETPEIPTNNSPLLARLAPFFPVCAVDECGHEVHEGPCPECQKDGIDIDCTTKDSPNVKDKNQLSEVEVNLSILDEHGKYDITDLVTKLSIHVRYPRDVEVILPVPANIYCDQDDLYILKDHYDTNGEPNWAYDGEYHNVVYDIDGNTVELHVEFVAPANDDITTGKTGFIRVYTKGINEDVIAYLYKNFGDGINFEIFNYYNRGTKYTTGKYPEIEAEELQGYLNHSMINFDWEEMMVDRAYPAYYIMAFNELDKDAATGDGDINEKDCYVWIFGDDRANHNDFYYDDDVNYKYSRDLTTNWYSVNETAYRDENERSFFHNAYKGTHYNSSKYNWIFTHKGVTGSADPAENPMYTPMPGEFKLPFE